MILKKKYNFACKTILHRKEYTKMPVDKKTSARHLLLDKLFRTSDGLSYVQIKKELADKGISVTVRTIQQDISSFENDYGATFEKGRRKGHSVLIRYRDITKSVLDRSRVTDWIIQMSEKIQKDNDLYPHYVLASSIIQHLVDGNSIEAFYDSVDFGSNKDLTNIELFGDILKAIINKQCISFFYKPYNRETRFVTVSPYKLKQFNQRWYLICKTIGYDRYFLDALDRIEGGISISDTKYEEFDNRRLGGIFDTIGTTSALDDNCMPEDVVLKVSKKRYPFIESKPIHSSQTCIETNEDSYTITLHVKINPELESTILYFGDDVEVLMPLPFRYRIQNIINNLATKYNLTTK